jgi:hypothetical protein
MEFDGEFGLRCVNTIINDYTQVVDMYKLLKKQDAPYIGYKISLSEMRMLVVKKITAYYEYLKNTGTDNKDSYLTKWMGEGSFADYDDEILYFVHR